MTVTSTPRRIKVQADKRAFKMLAGQAIGHDLLKGLIELITNSDDSYARLEKTGIKVDGRIDIEVDRRPRTKSTIIRVVDWAEGMDEAQLEQCVGNYGGDTSGQIGRGIFGMGLKDTINAFGTGVVTSFKDGHKFQCELVDVEYLDVYKSRLVQTSDRKLFRNANGGTVIEITVQNPDVKIPFIDTLRQQLQMHVCLRGIMSDPARVVTLRDLRSGSADKLHYDFPEGETVLKAEPLDLPDFPNVQATLTVSRADGPDLGQTGSYRTGGILICSQRSIHEATLFDLDQDPYAGKLFGELRCDAIYDLQVQGQPIVDKNRDGLRKNHELTKQIFAAARKLVEAIITQEREKEKHKRESLEAEETKRRFRDAIKNLNQIAQAELQLGGTAPGYGDREVGEPRLPVDGLEFIPDSYRVLVAERESLKLRIQVGPETDIAVGDRVEITCDNKHIKIYDEMPVVPSLFREDLGISVLSIKVEGLQANAQGFVTAKCKGKSAIAVVEVVSTKLQKEQSPSGGLFRDIRYEEFGDMPVRARFDRKDGTIYINTLGPSIDLYFGPQGFGQEQPANQVLVAELVTELACQEIARTKRETKILDIPPGVDELEAFNTHREKLKAQYAPHIHKALVASEYRRAGH